MERITYNDLKEKIVEGGVLVVDCYADWCGPCRTLTPLLETIEGKMTDVKFVKVNIDTDGEVATENGIRNIPTVLLIKDGEIIDKISGVKPENEYIDKITNMQNG